MNFKKDLLLIDLETTGLDEKKQEIIQIAALLLDKKTLKEKKFFNSYVKPVKWKQRDLESMAVNNIAIETVKNAPPLSKVLQSFNDAFGSNVILSYYVGITDIKFLMEAYKKSNIPYPFDYHTFNIWGPMFVYGATKNVLKSKKDFTGFGLASLAKHFSIPVIGNLHEALTDCRVEAEIFRNVIKNLQ